MLNGDRMEESITLDEYNSRIARFIRKIENERPGKSSEYTHGVTDGLDWAVRILNGDKSAG